MRIKEYSKGYFVREDGSVFSTWMQGKNSRPYVKWHQLRPFYEKSGYASVYIYPKNGGKRQRKRLHRLLAESFLDNPLNLPCVRHLDGNPKNNNLDNLAWGSYLENEHDKKKHGTWNDRVGGRKLSDKDIKNIRVSTLSQEELSKIYNVSRPTITRLLNGSTWQSF